MPTVTANGLAFAIDIMARIGFVLAAGLLLARTARKDAALSHAILAAGLVAAFLMPAGMLILQVIPSVRWERGSLDPEGFDVSKAGSLRLSERQHPSASPDYAGPKFVPASGDDEAYHFPLAPTWLNAPSGRLIAGGLIAVLPFVSILKSAGLGFSLVRLRRIVKRARPVADDRLLSMLDLIQRRMPMRHPLRLLESDEVSAPVAAGIIGPFVLLPTGWAESSGPDETLGVLCHESAHLARRDHRVLLLQEVLASVLWFHPLVHPFNRRLSRVREELCDNHAIALVNRAPYCEAFLLLTVARPGIPPRGATSVWTRRWSLEDRVRDILDERRPTRTGISSVARLATATFALSVGSLIALPQSIAFLSVDRIASADSSPAANEMTRSLFKSFPVSGERMLRIENLAGRVELIPGKGTTVEVEAMVRVSELEKGEAERLIDDIRWVDAPTEEGEPRWGLMLPERQYPTVRYAVSGESPPGITTVNHLGREIRVSDRPGKSIPALEFDLRIAVPPQARVSIHNAIGPVGGADLVAPLQVTTHAGSIQLRNVGATLTAFSELGPIMISKLKSDASLRTGSGGIELTQIAAGRVDLTTRSGGCRIVQRGEDALTLRNVGKHPLVFPTEAVFRSFSRSNDQGVKLLTRGARGPVITVDYGTTIYRITDHFSASIPFCRSINPITKADAEGVKPDVAAPADQALLTAHLLALKKSLAKYSDKPDAVDNLKRAITDKEKELAALKAK